MRILARWFVSILFAAAGFSPCARAADAAPPSLPYEVKMPVDKAVVDALADTGAPSASIAIVKDGKIVYRHAYGMAQLKPTVPATPAMRYRIGSVSKQFVSAAVLMLAEEGKLSLDDKVDHWLPDLTRGGEVSVRQLLSMTAGYQDYWPQDYLIPPMLEPTTPQEILKQWGHKPLDFEPGSKWQYSNTNYVIAGLIVEKASGMALFDFLNKRIFKPLAMTTVINKSALAETDAIAYRRYGLGPLRPAPTEGAGWLFASCDLAMTASDLALWDLCVISQQLLKPQSWSAMQTEVQTTKGIGTLYGLGVGVRMAEDRRLIWHDGLVSGFTAQNFIFPDDRAAIVVLTNMDGNATGERIASRVATLILPPDDPDAPAALKQAREILQGLQRANINRKLLTANASDYFSTQAVVDISASLRTLGPIQDFVQAPRSQRGGMTLRRYRARFTEKAVDVSTYITAEGKIDQYLITPAD